jgi:hypothetical protein
MGEGGGPRRLLPASRIRPAKVVPFARAGTFELPHDAQNEISFPIRQAGAFPRDRPGRVVPQGLHGLSVEVRLPVPVHPVGGLDAERPRQGYHVAQGGSVTEPLLNLLTSSSLRSPGLMRITVFAAVVGALLRRLGPWFAFGGGQGGAPRPPTQRKEGTP